MKYLIVILSFFMFSSFCFATEVEEPKPIGFVWCPVELLCNKGMSRDTCNYPREKFSGEGQAQLITEDNTKLKLRYAMIDTNISSFSCLYYGTPSDQTMLVASGKVNAGETFRIEGPLWELKGAYASCDPKGITVGNACFAVLK